MDDNPVGDISAVLQGPQTSHVPQVIDDLKWHVKSFAISATASAIGAIAVYPVDLVKTRMQNQSKPRSSIKGVANAVRLGAASAASSSIGSGKPVIYKNSYHCFRHIIKTEGARNLYRGLTPNLLGQVPEKALRLFVVEKVRSLVRSRQNDENVNGIGEERGHELMLSAEIAAGLAAGTCQVVITNPAEIVKVRLQTAGQTGVANARKQPGALQVLRELGFNGMYRGASACFLRDVPFSGMYFPIYAYSKHRLTQGNDHNSISATKLLLAGSIAGVFAAGLTTPADVLKTRLQAKPSAGMEPYKGLIDCALRTTRSEGVSALFKGVIPRVLRSSPQYAIMLLVYDLLHKAIMPAEMPRVLMEPDTVGLSFKVDDRWNVMNVWVPPTSFTADAGSFSRLAVGGQGNVWGLGPNGDVYTWSALSRHGTGEWKRVKATPAKYVSVGADGAVCTVTDGGLPMSYDPWNVQFRPMPTTGLRSCNLKLVSVGHSQVIWGLGEDGQVFKFKPKNGSWRKRSSRKMTHISVGMDGSVWGIEAGTSKAFKWMSDVNEWEPMPGTFKVVSVSSRHKVWGIDEHNETWRWSAERHEWVRLDKRMSHVSAAADGTVLGAAVPDHDDVMAKIKFKAVQKQ